MTIVERVITHCSLHVLMDANATADIAKKRSQSVGRYGGHERMIALAMSQQFAMSEGSSMLCTVRREHDVAIETTAERLTLSDVPFCFVGHRCPFDQLLGKRRSSRLVIGSPMVNAIQTNAGRNRLICTSSSSPLGSAEK